ncbi:sugar transporter SWEET1 isoform X2 [Leptidea sinapis]|uniref:sugar transporter SWEET1 isoform X2 n=1 Tax=Leptidea sinapis TaxID=189913 RepID=UPI0021C414B7|nr:sugar transporter SWEET1 isoform X2 [Leptidea sinapis]
MFVLADLKQFIECLAVVTTILQFLSGVLVCKRYVYNGTTGEASSLPFTCGFLSCSIWFLYGITKYDGNLVLVNSVGVILMVSYIVVFYLHTLKKTAVLRQAYIALGLCVFAIVYAYNEEDNDTLLEYLAPMSQLVYVVRMKSTECLPFPMILMYFVVSSLWFIYGLIEVDHYLMATNIIGASLALAQLSLFVIYPSQHSSSNILKTTLA